MRAWHGESRGTVLTTDYADHADILSVPIRVIRGLILCAVARPAVTTDAERLGRRLLCWTEHAAEQGRCTEPPFALGTGALEFWSFDKSGLGGR